MCDEDTAALVVDNGSGMCKVRILNTSDTVQDFLISLGIKPLMLPLEITIFSINHVIVRPTNIMIRAHWSLF